MSNFLGFLSQIKIDEQEIFNLRLNDPYQWHKYVWSLFSNKENRDFLFFVDRYKRPAKVLILSKRPPDNTENFMQTIPLTTDFFANKKYYFEIYCNPTQKKKVTLEDGTAKKNGKRIGILRKEECLNWLVRKGENGGFTVNHLESADYELVSFNKSGKKGTIAAIHAKGILDVTDKNLFIQTYFNGLGSAKGLGFGLIKIIPIKESSHETN